MLDNHFKGKNGSAHIIIIKLNEFMTNGWIGKKNFTNTKPTELNKIYSKSLDQTCSCKLDRNSGNTYKKNIEVENDDIEHLG